MEDRLCTEEHCEVEPRRIGSEHAASTTKGMPQHVHKDYQGITQIAGYSVGDR